MLGILRRVFDFSDWQASHPSTPPPGDMLDASFDAQDQKINEIETEILGFIRSDGAMQNAVVHRDAIQPETYAYIKSAVLADAGAIRDETVVASNEAMAARFMASNAQENAQTAAEVAISARNDSQSALTDALSQVQTMLDDARASIVQLETVESQLLAITAPFVSGNGPGEVEAWASTSRAWAEYMPDTIPAEVLNMMAVTGDHWSSRWWANQAANAFGMLTSLYLGVHSTPPLANANGGPIETGSIYYDSDDHQPYVWTGSSWQPFYQSVNRANLSTLWYVATAGQTVFPLTTADMAGKSFIMNAAAPEQLDSHVNGIKLMPANDWTVNVATSTVTFLRPLRAGDAVAIDVLMPAASLAPGAAQAYSLKPLTGIDGVKTVFALETKIVPAVPVSVGAYEELVVSLDGVIQEPGVSYSATGANITFVQAPALDSHVFITWLRPLPGSGGGGGGSGIPEAPTDGQQYGRQSSSWTVVSGGGGAMTGTAILAALAPVDGAGSGLDADLLDGQSSAFYATASSLAAYAPLASPTLTGTPAAPTAATATNTTQIATTAFVKAQNYLTTTDTAAQILTKLLTIDGSGSLLDADLLDNHDTAYFLARANHTGTQTLSTISDAGTAAARNIFVGTSAPGSPATNDIWIDTT